MGLVGRVRVTETAEELRAEITGEELGILIGRRGQTIDAVEYLAGIAVFPGIHPRKHVELDAEGYKDRRRRQIEGVALRKADEAAKRGCQIVTISFNGAAQDPARRGRSRCW